MKKLFMLIPLTFLVCNVNCNNEIYENSNIEVLCKREKSSLKAKNSSYSPSSYLAVNHPYDMGEMRKDGLIGRHAFFEVHSIEDNGYQVCNTFTNFYAPGAFEDVTLTFTYSETTTVSLSTTEKFNVYATNGFNVTAQIPNFAKITSEDEIGKSYTFSNTNTYTASEIKETKITHTLSDEATNDQEKKYAVGTVGYVYELECKYYETHWLWRNNTEILQDTVRDFTMYIVKDPYMDVVYQDGTFFENVAWV